MLKPYLFLTAVAIVRSQYATYLYPQTSTYGNPYPSYNPYVSNQYTFTQPQYQYGAPVYGGITPVLLTTSGNNGMGGSTTVSAQTFMATKGPNQGLGFGPPNGTPVMQSPVATDQGTEFIAKPSVNQAANPPIPPAQPEGPLNSVVEMEIDPLVQNPGHYDYYAYGRDGLGSPEGKHRTVSQRPYYVFRPPSYIRNGSPIRVQKPDHFEYVAYGRAEPSFHVL